MPVHRFSLTGTLSLAFVAACFVIILLERTGVAPQLRPLTSALYSWTVLLAAFALLLGVANVALVHFRRIYTGQRDWVGSLALLVALFAILLTGLFDTRGMTAPAVDWFFDAIIAPGQATIFALLAFFMAAAAYRYLRIGRRGGAWMLAGALVIFVAQLPIFALPPAAQTVFNWLLSQPISATFRGVLLGSSLALIVIAVRFLLGRTEV
ncbi:MAG: hypothetical protein DCC55_15825 [Chloroflexi bacterium]|nr:MAG: hypothetical protein DCC55_15825 [Chloroflexota bacterium]